MKKKRTSEADRVVDGGPHDIFRRALEPRVVVIGDDFICKTIVRSLERAGLAVDTLEAAEGLPAVIERGAPSVVISFTERFDVKATVERHQRPDAQGHPRPAFVRVSASPEWSQIDAPSTTVRSSVYMAAVTHSQIVTQLGGAVAHALGVDAPDPHLARALGLDDVLPMANDSIATLELGLAQYRGEFTRALAWAGPMIGFEGRALVARCVLDAHSSLTAAIRVVSERNKPLPTLVLNGALPRVNGAVTQIEPERGISGFIASIGEIEIGEPALDRRFIISGDRERAMEWRSLAGPLTVLATHGDVRGELGPEEIVLRVDGASAWTAGECASALHQAWVTLANGRMGFRTEPD